MLNISSIGRDNFSVKDSNSQQNNNNNDTKEFCVEMCGHRALYTSMWPYNLIERIQLQTLSFCRSQSDIQVAHLNSNQEYIQAFLLMFESDFPRQRLLSFDQILFKLRPCDIWKDSLLFSTNSKIYKISSDKEYLHAYFTLWETWYIFHEPFYGRSHSLLLARCQLERNLFYCHYRH